MFFFFGGGVVGVVVLVLGVCSELMGWLGCKIFPFETLPVLAGYDNPCVERYCSVFIH